MSSTSAIPMFYQVVFKYIDPFFCTIGVTTHIFQKNKVLLGLSTKPAAPQAPETKLLLNFMVGFFAMLGCMQVTLVRAAPDNIPVWQALQLSTLVLDVVQIVATLQSASSQGRASPSTWLPGENQNVWGNMGIGAIRAAFVLGVGLS